MSTLKSLLHRSWTFAFFLIAVSICLLLFTSPAIAGYTDSAHGNSDPFPGYGVNRSGADYATGDCANCHETFDPEVCAVDNHLLFTPNSPPWSQTNNFCFECHKGTGSVQEGGITNYDYSKAFGGAPTAEFTNIYDAFNTSVSSHDLAALLSWVLINHGPGSEDDWGFTSTSNPCLVCHSTHRAKKNYPVNLTGTLNTAIRLPSRNKSTLASDFLWGDDENETMAYYAGSAEYQPPYYGDTSGNYFEPTGTGVNYGGSRTPDYATFCLDCHKDILVNVWFHGNSTTGLDWTIDAHGLADGMWPMVLPYDNPPYANYVLSCLDCHEPHGSNSAATFELGRTTINGVQVGNASESCIPACHWYEY